MLNNFFPKIAPFMTMWKNWMETEGLRMTSQHGAYAFHAGLARAHTRPRTHMHARTHTHTPISNTRIAFPRQQQFANYFIHIIYIYITLYIHCLSCYK